MPVLSLAVVAFTVLTQATQPAGRQLPADWPPLPDFKTPIDYVAWMDNRLNGHVTDDARPLYDALFELPDDSEETRQAKEKALGCNERGTIPGLLTEYHQVMPLKYAWDPALHPSWEHAYQTQRDSGVHEKLAAIGRCTHMSLPITFHDATFEVDDPDKPGGRRTIDGGIRKEDRLLAMAGIWPGTRLMLAQDIVHQNAWRAPGARVDPEEMIKAIATSLRISDHRGQISFVGYMSGLTRRHYAYQTALRALAEGCFEPAHLDSVLELLTTKDSQNLLDLYSPAGELAGLMDILQFAYIEADGTFHQPPRVNKEHIARIQAYLNASNETYSSLKKEIPDITSLMERCDPIQAVDQIIGFHLRARRIWETELPCAGSLAIGRMADAFKSNPGNHVLIQQFLVASEHPLRYGANVEAARRATHLLYALHRHHARSGRWPRTLFELNDIPSTLRTDPWSRTSFIYRLQDGEPLLYSVACNRKDDGGKHDRNWGLTYENGEPKVINGDYVFWPLPKESD